MPVFQRLCASHCEAPQNIIKYIFSLHSHSRIIKKYTMKILNVILVVAYAKRPCSISSCLVCETNPYLDPEICQATKTCCEKVNKYFSENINKVVSKISTVSKRKIETKASMHSFSSSMEKMSIPEIVNLFAKTDDKTSSLSIFVFICIISCFLIAGHYYLNYLKTHWSIY